MSVNCSWCSIVQGPGILAAFKATEQFFWFVQRVLLFIRGNKNEHRNSVFLYYVSVCIRNSQKVCVDVLGGFCFVFKMPPNWANNIKMRMACGSLNGCELNSHLSSALCTAALLSIYYVVCRLKESCKKIFLVFLTTNSLFFFLHEWKYHSILKLVFLLDESGFEWVQSSTYRVRICLKFVILLEFDSTLSQMCCGKIKYYPKNPADTLTNNN